MRDEVSVAVSFITRLVQRSGGEQEIKKEQLEVFKARLMELLCDRFRNHWFPDKPSRGQGFRCIRLNKSDRKDQLIDLAAKQSGLVYDQLGLPAELTIWVDPKEVSCRFGEHEGSFCTLASFKSGSEEMVLEDVNLDEIYKKNLEQKEKVVQEMSTRRNGRRGFLSGSPNFKGGRTTTNSHSGRGHGIQSPNPIAVNWFNSVNSASNSSADMFSSSPPNQYSTYSLAKFSPPKYGYGTASKWSTSSAHPSYGHTHPAAKTDKYHWFNGAKPTIKA